MKPDEEPLLDAFGRVMDEYLKVNNIKMLIEIPEGTTEPKTEAQITENIKLGSIVKFYILLTAFVPVLRNMVGRLNEDFDWLSFIDSCLDLVKAEVVEGMESEGGK